MIFVRQPCVLVLSAVMVLGQTGSFQIRAIEGDGATVTTGAPSPQPLTVLVTGADGHPLSGAAVTFRLPTGGPTARFSSGMLSESVVTDGDGRATVRGVRWGHEPGSAVVRVSANLNNQRADTELHLNVVPGSISNAPGARESGKSSSRKWIVIAGVAAGALAGIAFGMGGGGSSASPSAPPQQPNQTIVIQPPTITIGRP